MQPPQEQQHRGHQPSNQPIASVRRYTRTRSRCPNQCCHQRPPRRAPTAAAIRAFLVVTLVMLVALNNVAMWFFSEAREVFDPLVNILLLMIGFYFGNKASEGAT